MSTKENFILIVPAYNEEENLDLIINNGIQLLRILGKIAAWLLLMMEARIIHMIFF